ncbi:MAG: alpha/beta hydrolase [Rhodospirillaceae bacterium]|jgi:pimeloyl-ACP methyl ester carboxylesterase|nr:alpha/beta hydrolase [Rhodospirillaceae bacterium]MBT7266840.1 alpha/beta hydrolase [Rhodospirillaceae bacterium]
MANFVLVHGMGAGGWQWRKVANFLRAQGHLVFTPTLTGLGERTHLLTPKTDLETHICDIANVIECEELEDVVLVGHSYGGMVVTGAADRQFDRIGTLIYLDAFLPENGQSVMDLQPPDRIDYYHKMAKEKGEGWRIPPPPAEFWKLTDPDDIAQFDRLRVDHPLASLTQPVTLDHPRPEKRAYVWASGFTPSPFEKFAKACEQDESWVYREIGSGHQMMMSHPKEVAEILVGLLN